MTTALADALADAREIRRIRRAQWAVVRRYRAATAGSRPARTAWRQVWWQLPPGLAFPAAPLLIPLFVWLAPATESGQPGGLQFLACLLAFVFRGHLFQSRALEFPADEALHAPSKAGLLLVRLFHHVPGCLFVGACLGAALAIRLGPTLAEAWLGGGLLLAAATLSPMAQTVGKLRARLGGEGASVLGPLLVPTLAAWVCVAQLREPPGPLRTVLLLVVILLGLAAVVRIARDWWRQPRLQLRAAAAELAMVPHTLAAIGLLVPQSLLRDLALHPAWGAGALVVVVLAALHALSRLVVEVRFAEESTHGAAIRRADGEATAPAREPSLPVVLPVRARGQRSLLQAQGYLHRRTAWYRPGELRGWRSLLRNLPGLLWRIFFHAWGAMLATLAVVGTVDTHFAATMALLAGFTAPTFVSIRPSWHLHRLGIDFVEQLRHNLRAFALVAALPTLLAALAAGAIAGWTDNRLLVVGLLVASLAARAGWRGFTTTGDLAGPDWRAAPAAVALVLGSLRLPAPPGWLVLLVLLAGLLGIARRWTRLREPILAEAMRNDDAGA